MGIIMHRSPGAGAFLAPLRLLPMGISRPVLAILWTQGGTWTLILRDAALLMRVFQVAVAEGLCAVDPQIDEMTRPFRVLLRRRLGLQGTADRPAATLSKGQAQRIVLLRALSVRPDILLLDEALGGLDDEFWAMARGMGAKQHAPTGVAVIEVTHDPVWRLFQGRCLSLNHPGKDSHPGKDGTGARKELG
ncbi:ATP-binding cassette domain-containing protein [Rhodovulum sulfidophilum]|uniref:ATP-binding cassette domain-containing protein n=1 Tax=Rhodovulum sulfidophilum TaxID=35806 RepID=UPI001F5DE3EB|nr:ATP-binding cassette domain-containing protein [Rhodovulum sulfidophilum]